MKAVKFSPWNIVCFILCMAFFFSGSFAEGRSLEEIKQSKELRMCVAGSSHELYTRMGMAFAESLGIQAKVRKLDSWDQQFHNQEGVTLKSDAYTPHLLETGQCDFYPNDLVMHEWRKKKLDFVVLFRTRMTVVVHKENLNQIKSETDLKGKRAAVMKGTTYHTWMEEKNKSDFADKPISIRFMSTDESMKAVNSKAADFTIIGADGALNWTRNKVRNSVTAFFVGPATEVGWAFPKGDNDLREAARKFFDSQKTPGSQFDVIWKEKVGISLSEYALFIINMIGE